MKQSFRNIFYVVILGLLLEVIEGGRYQVNDEEEGGPSATYQDVDDPKQPAMNSYVLPIGVIAGLVLIVVGFMWGSYKQKSKTPWPRQPPRTPLTPRTNEPTMEEDANRETSSSGDSNDLVFVMLTDKGTIEL